MKVLIVGSGGREHALAWSIAQSPDLDRLFIAPGNGGTAELGENVPIDPLDVSSLLGFAVDNRVDLAVVGPEAPLVAGIVDSFTRKGLKCFGPTSKAARLEGSKVFAKEFMRRHDVPTADFEIFSDPVKAKEYASKEGVPLVIKADGLAQGKGVFVADGTQEAVEAVHAVMVEKRFGDSGGRIVIEKRLSGEELSVLAVVSGEEMMFFPAAQDHKRAFDGDEGPNTGGMGAYAPVPFIGEEEMRTIEEKIMKPAVRGMAEEGSPFSGVLYAGLMMTDSGPMVLEFNVRFGDPEIQALIPILKADLLAVLSGAVEGRIPEGELIHKDRSAATVVVASRGYPGEYEKGFPIEGIGEAGSDHRVVFHAGTKKTPEGVVTAGGRVLSVTAFAGSLREAIRHAYDGVEKISFEGAFYRKDIGKRAARYLESM